MNAEIVKHLPEIEKLCQEYGVTKLELFGSAVGPRFSQERSDFDLIATFAETPGIEFVRFANELEKLLGRRVDLMTNHPINNPFLKREIDSTRQVILDASVA